MARVQFDGRRQTADLTGLELELGSGVELSLGLKLGLGLGLGFNFCEVSLRLPS